MNLRKLAFIGIIIFSVTSSALAFNPGSEPDGFREIKWGTDISKLKGMEYLWTDDSGVNVYKRNGDVLKIGRANVATIRYNFWKEKFFRVYITTNGLENWRVLKEACFDKFGEAYKPNNYKEYYLWGLGKITGMSIGYDKLTGVGYLFIDSKEISKEVKIFEEKARQKLKTVEGF